MEKQKWALLLAVLVVGVASAGWHYQDFYPLVPTYLTYSDIVSLFPQAIGSFPYSPSALAYPVLTEAFVYVTAHLGATIQVYYILNCVFLILCAVVTAYFIYEMVNKKNKWKTVYFLAVSPTLLLFLIYNWDMLAVMLATVGLYFMLKKRNLLASFFFALGFCAKIYPGLFLIPLVLKERKDAPKALVVFAITAILINLPFMLYNFGNWAYFFHYNSARGPNVDSIWYIAASALGLFNSIQTINYASLIIFVAATAILLFRYRKESALKLCYCMLIIFLLTNKIFSPQYLLWLLPFFAIFQKPSRFKILALEMSNVFVTVFVLIFLLPQAQALANLNLVLTHIFVVAREILLLVLLILILKDKKTSP